MSLLNKCIKLTLFALLALAAYLANVSPPDAPWILLVGIFVVACVLWSPRQYASRATAVFAVILCLFVYFGLIQWTTIEKNGKRFQIGFGLADWTLNSEGEKWKKKNPGKSVHDLVNEAAAYDDGELPIYWNYREPASNLLCICLLGFCTSFAVALRTIPTMPIGEQLKRDAGLRIPGPATYNLWYRFNPESDTTFVFIHGVMSDSRCWMYVDEAGGNVEYWPHLIETDPRFGDHSIFLAGYYTNLDAGISSIRNCADEVFGALRRTDGQHRPAPLQCKRIVFICHSMGGIVARYMLESNHREFADKEIGLVLVASPSFGSELANGLSWIIDLYRHRQGKQLKWGNDFLDDLDDRFRTMLDQDRIPALRGVEFYEHRFIAPGPLFFLQWKWLPLRVRWSVVTKESAGRYFGAAKLLPNTDHFSVVKPDGINHVSHVYLYDFLMEKQLLGAPAVKSMQQVDELPRDKSEIPTAYAGKLPRIYISYTHRTTGLKQAALEFAEKLKSAGVDVRHDLFYAKSLHGFTPPDPLPDRDAWEAWQEEQIREADFVIVVCSPEYVASPPDSGAWRDMQFMQRESQSGRSHLRQFIPAGFGPYDHFKPLIPGFLKGATYFDLTAEALNGFGFDDLLRWIKSHPTNSSVTSAKHEQANTSSANGSNTRFHVFLSHNSEDKDVVKQLGKKLKIAGLNPWLDEWELRPGLAWQDALEDIIVKCESAAVCVGRNGIGPWEDPEMKGLLRRFVKEKKSGSMLPVIPVLLPGAPPDIELPLFLNQFTWVDLRDGVTKTGMDRLIWGITGTKATT